MCLAVRGMRWGILHAGGGQFLRPDRYHQTWVFPLSPAILLAAGRSQKTPFSRSRRESEFDLDVGIPTMVPGEAFNSCQNLIPGKVTTTRQRRDLTQAG